MARTQGKRKLIRQQEKFSLAEKKELGELDKNVTPPFIPTTPLNSFCSIFQPPLPPLKEYEITTNLFTTFYP